MNAVDRLIQSPLPTGQNPLELCGRRADGGFEMADDMPALHPNDAALVLFRETLGEMRDTNAKVGEVREIVARMEGRDLPGALAAHDERLNLLASRVAAIESDAKVLAAVRKPWVAALRRFGELTLAALVGFAATFLSGSHHP